MAEITRAKDAAPKKTEFDVILLAAGDNVGQVIQVIRELTGLGLDAAKDLVASPPTTLKDGVPKSDAEEMRKQLTDAGATVDLK
ncbi:ribosomal protein L7/L12 [Nannocystis sp. RBIL2]|nr:50S ribosomal protein L7/L12 [Nannocystis sp. RBIL2]MCY1068415.1 ribosomal protein L7/L12 [Nannocystis sp. RBIL2]